MLGVKTFVLLYSVAVTFIAAHRPHGGDMSCWKEERGAAPHVLPTPINGPSCASLIKSLANSHGIIHAGSQVNVSCVGCVVKLSLAPSEVHATSITISLTKVLEAKNKVLDICEKFPGNILISDDKGKTISVDLWQPDETENKKVCPA